MKPMHFTKTTKIILLALFVTLVSAQAQVTVGLDEDPVDGALLQIKEKEGITDDSENSTKGLAFPRVALLQKNRLYPMFGNATSPANGYKTDAEIAAKHKQHVGLIVYNIHESPDAETDPNLKFRKGLYVWTGTEWGSVASSEVDVQNGISLSNEGIIKLGGSLTENTTISQGKNNMTFNAEAAAFTVNTKKSNMFVVKDSTVAIGGMPVSNAALKIDATNKGLLLPRIQLKDSEDNKTIPLGASDKGMTVYHTGSESMESGLHVWSGSTWKRVITTIPPVPDKDANVREITETDYKLVASPAADDYDKAEKLPFDTIRVPEDGTYAFAVRMSGKTNGSGFPTTLPTFFYLKHHTPNPDNPSEYISSFVDGQTFYAYAQVSSGSIGATVYLVARNCKAGDLVEIYGATYSGRSIRITLYQGIPPKPSRTSVVFWKL